MLSPFSTPAVSANFNDLRLTKRYNTVLGNLKSCPNGTIPQACASKAEIKGYYRFIHNKKVNHKNMLKGHLDSLEISATQGQSGRCLFLTDSSELDFTSKRSASNLGPLTSIYRRGMILHNTLMISNLGVSCGLFSQAYIQRKDKDFGKSKKRKNLPIEKKESVKWLNDFNKIQKYVKRLNIEGVYIADRESDIIEIFHARRYEKMHYIIRSQHNRRLDNSPSKLYSYLKQQPNQHTYQLEVTDPKTLQSRTATLAVRYCPVDIKSSSNLKRKKDLGVNKLNAIEVYELNPPENVKPIRWVLLTSLPIDNFKDALQVIRYYIWRWIVERFFYLLKSGGAKVEQLQIEQPTPLKNTITLYSIALMDIMKIKQLAEKQPDMCVYNAGITPKDCEILFTYAHQRLSNKINFDEDNPPTVWEFCRVLGMIGGFIPSKRQPIPGLKILSRAVEKFYLLSFAYNAYMSKNSKDVGYQ